MAGSCIDCYTTGTALVTTAGVKWNHTFLEGVHWRDSAHRAQIEAIFKNGSNMEVDVSLDNFGGHFEFDISFSASQSVAIPLFVSETPAGIEVSL